MEAALILVLGYVIFVIVSFFFVRCNRLMSRKAISGAHRVLLVIAHPDDECMFFGPTILGLLKEAGVQFYVLCLSIGDFEKKGNFRKDELWRSCAQLGIPSANITLLNYANLQDDPATIWPVELVRRVVLSHVYSLQIDTLITFDDQGVSGHLNHISCFKSVENLVTSRLLPSYCRAYCLESVNIVRKYVSGKFDLPISYLFSSFMYVCSGAGRLPILGAMKCHASQDIWYRKMYVQMSRYLVVNTLAPISHSSGSPNDDHPKRE